jgi:hypothetical protein
VREKQSETLLVGGLPHATIAVEAGVRHSAQTRIRDVRFVVTGINSIPYTPGG